MLKICILAFCLTASLGVVPLALSPAATAAPMLGRSDLPHSRTVTFKAADNTVIKAEYWAPKGKKRAPAALLIHAAGADRSQLKPLAERMYKSGYAVLVPDLRGHGETLVKETDAFSLLTDKAAMARAWAFATRDVEAAARWMRTNRSIHSSNLNLLGVGSGAALAVHQAAKDENTRSVTLISPRKTMLGFNLVKDLFDLEGVPTFLVTSKEGRDEVEAMAQSIHDDIDSEPFIAVINLKAKKATEALADRKLGSSITRPLKLIAFPTRGRR